MPPNSIHYAAHRPAGLDLAPPFLNFSDNAIDAGRHCVGIGIRKERAKFNVEILAHPRKRFVNFGIGFMGEPVWRGTPGAPPPHNHQGSMNSRLPMM